MLEMYCSEAYRAIVIHRRYTTRALSGGIFAAEAEVADVWRLHACVLLEQCSDTATIVLKIPRASCMFWVDSGMWHAMGRLIGAKSLVKTATKCNYYI